VNDVSDVTDTPGVPDRSALDGVDVPIVLPHEVGQLGQAILDAVATVVVGNRAALELVLAGILAGGNVLLEDLPGLGKTLTARSFAQVLGIGFRRVQFTPDLLPADVTGSFLYDQRNHDFVFRPGPIFTNLLLADEINRTPPKTQSALLEAMQEKQVSVEGTTYMLAPPFHVLATANPIEYEGTYPLPEAQLDRFLLRVSFGYPSHDDEWTVLQRRISRRREEAQLTPLGDAGMLLGMQAALEDVTVEDSIGQYMVDLTAATREHSQVLVGASPRGSLALMLLSRAKAALAGRDYVIPEDVKQVAKPALAHRITLKPEVWLRRVDPSSVVADIVAKTATPTSGALPSYATGPTYATGPSNATGPSYATGPRPSSTPPADHDRYRPPRG
jgi:MoxR-like ATPase